MDDTTKAIIERLKASGKLWPGSVLHDPEDKEPISIMVGGSRAWLVPDDATPEKARAFAELAGVDVSDIK